MLWPWQLWLRDTPEQKFAPAVPHTHQRGACILRSFFLGRCSEFGEGVIRPLLPDQGDQASRSIGLLTLNTWTIWNIGTSTRVSLSEAPVCATTIWSQSMTKSKLLGLAAILSAVIATPALAAGETATRPWSAPVGHRQPRAVDIPPSVSPQVLDQEDIDVDRKIRGVCRGC
jgi:hypothetical protein